MRANWQDFKIVVKCNGKVIINMEENEITFENQKPFLNETDFKVQ